MRECGRRRRRPRVATVAQCVRASSEVEYYQSACQQARAWGCSAFVAETTGAWNQAAQRFVRRLSRANGFRTGDNPHGRCGAFSQQQPRGRWPVSWYVSAALQRSPISLQGLSAWVRFRLGLIPQTSHAAQFQCLSSTFGPALPGGSDEICDVEWSVSRATGLSFFVTLAQKHSKIQPAFLLRCSLFV